jgi:signal recognition particle receptor subunit beta
MNSPATHLKIVFAGSVGAGKTTSISAISDVGVISTEEATTDEVNLLKDLTTVAMDYGQIHLEDGSKIHVYGAPGQRRFDFMWEILSQGSLGVILLIDDTAEDPLRELKLYFDAFSLHMKSKTLVVGITRADLNINHDIGEYRRFVATYDRTIPIFAIDSRNRDEVKSLVRTLLYRIDPWL